MRPETATYPAYFNAYIKLVEGDDINLILARDTAQSTKFFENISEEQSHYKYDDEKWTVKEVLQHVNDTERIFCYRALAIARGESNALPGFDENAYGKNTHANTRKWADLVEEFKSIRTATSTLIKSFSGTDWKKSGAVSDYQINVAAICFTIAGHVLHHINIIKERYLEVAV